MNHDEIRLLTPQYLSDQLESSLKLAFEQALSENPELRAEVDELRRTWDDLGALPPEFPSAAMRARFYNHLEEIQSARRKPKWWEWPHWSPRFAPQISVALSLFLIGFYVRGTVDKEHNSETTQMRAEIHSLRETLAVSLLDRPSASARLEGISWGRRVDHPDGQVASALLTALNHDPNVNVRLAAVDALQSLAADRSIREALVDSVPVQTSPIVQIALIDLLVQVHATEATPALKKLAGDPQTQHTVRGHLLWALDQLGNPDLDTK